MSVFFFIIVIVGLVTCGEVVTKFLERGSGRPALDPGRDAEVGQLRDQVESLATQVERLSEEQRFMTRLLEGSPEGTARGSGPQTQERTDGE